MHKKEVEIYSDTTNRAIIRHPGRKFPGVLIQGDSLHAMCKQADDICAGAGNALNTDTLEEMNDLRNRLWDYLIHYKKVLSEHGVQAPFNEEP